jgi:hypothetical protein
MTRGNGLVSATPIQLPYPRPDPIQDGTGTGISQYNPAIAPRGNDLVSATPIQLPYPRPEPVMRGIAGHAGSPVKPGRNDPVSATPIQLP